MNFDLARHGGAGSRIRPFSVQGGCKSEADRNITGDGYDNYLLPNVFVAEKSLTDYPHMTSPGAEFLLPYASAWSSPM
jgi:hypothetical protein